MKQRFTTQQACRLIMIAATLLVLGGGCLSQSDMSYYQSLERLQKLRESGAMTEEDYRQAVAESRQLR